MTGQTAVAASRQPSTTRAVASALRIGVLIDTLKLHPALHEFLLWAQAEDGIDVAAAIVFRPSADTPDRLLGCVRAAAFLLVAAIERFIVRVLGARGHLGFGSSFTGASLTLSLDRLDLSCARIAVGCGRSMSAKTAARLAGFDLDILIQCGASVVPDALAAVAKFGVVRFHYGDPGNHLPGFWETYHRLDSVECSIERYSPTASPHSLILMRGRFATKLLYTLTRSHLEAKAFAHLKRVLKDHAHTWGANAVPGIAQRAVTETDRDPRAHQSLFYLLKILFRLARLLLFKLARFEQRWRISILDAPWRRVELPQGLLLRPPRGRFWADPFLYERNGKLFCFFEEFDYGTARGHISVAEVRGATVVPDSRLLNEPFHLSFPYIFEFEGEIFMCPECEEARTIRLYRAVEFPRKWQLAHVLMQNVAAVDTMIFKHGDRWWMLTNMDCSARRDYGAELYVFHADSPLSGRWLPHPQNPVKIDCEGGRNGGMITESGKLYRIGQRQAFGQYGRGVLIYEIDVLNDTSYHEEFVTEFKPGKASGILGLHHLTVAGGRTAVDFAKRELVLWS